MTYRERRRQQLLHAIHLWMRRHGAWFVLALSFSILSPGTAFAAVKPIQAKVVKQEAAAQEPVKPEKNKDEKTVEKTVTGTVMFVRKNKISVEFVSDAEKGGEDILLSLDKKLKLKNVKDISAIRQGDQVQVKYVETYREPKEKGQEKVILSRVGTELKFIKKAPPAPKPESDALTGGEGL